MSQAFRGFPPAPAWARELISVGVTGTNGKTTTTRWIAAALRTLGRPVLSITTVGGFFDDEPWGLMDSHDEFLHWARKARDQGARCLAIETTSEALALGFAQAWPMRVGVFTNLSHDHLDAHHSPEHYLASKAQLFVNLPSKGAAVLNAREGASNLLREVLPKDVTVLDYARSADGARMTAEHFLAASAEKSTRPMSGGRPGSAPPPGPGGLALRTKNAVSAHLLAFDINVSWSGTSARLCADDRVDEPIELYLPAIGDVYVDNAMAALSAAKLLGVSWARGAEALRTAAPVPGRFEVVCHHPHVVVDYAHTPDALEKTLRTARGLCRGRLIVVFGAGGDRDRSKRMAMGHSARVADQVILTSDNPRHESPAAIAAQIASGLENHDAVHIELDRREAITSALRSASQDDLIVIAGKGHETTQTVGDDVVPMDDVALVRGLCGS
jgi:UDP-N-acetylmuramoyl-L-alanyl-D-glutamate--2,6-diaminopimelate ligase